MLCATASEQQQQQQQQQADDKRASNSKMRSNYRLSRTPFRCCHPKPEQHTSSSVHLLAAAALIILLQVVLIARQSQATFAHYQPQQHSSGVLSSNSNNNGFALHNGPQANPNPLPVQPQDAVHAPVYQPQQQTQQQQQQQPPQQQQSIAQQQAAASGFDGANPNGAGLLPDLLPSMNGNVQPQQQSPPQQQQQQQQPAADTAKSYPRAVDGPIFRYHGFPLNSTTVKLVWNLLAGYHADYFDIEYGPIPESTNVHSIPKLNGTARDYTVHQLAPDTLYQFQLTGYTNDRQRYKPQLVAVRTPPANQLPSRMEYVRELMPLGVKAEAKSNNSIQLSWTEPEKPANIRHSVRVNTLRYYIVNNPNSMTTNNNAQQQISNETTAQQQPTTPNKQEPVYHYLNVTNARESRLIVQRLKPATEYAFAIKTSYHSPDMKKLYAASGYSMDTFARTFDIEPTAPRNFTLKPVPLSREEVALGWTSSGKLDLSWLPPESLNGQLRGYVILYAHDKNVADEQWGRINVTEPDINNWRVADLRPGWSYYFKVRAINQRGQGPDSEVRAHVAPPLAPADKIISVPIPPSNVLMMIAICMIAIFFLLFLLVSRLACRPSRRAKHRKGSMNNNNNSNQQQQHKLTAEDAANVLAGTMAQSGLSGAKLNGYATTNSSSTVAARVGTLARRRDQSSNKPDFWISALDQPDIKSNISEKSNSDMNMAMVSIQRDSPQFATTQLAPVLPEYRYATSTGAGNDQEHQMMQQLQQQQGHYQAGQMGALNYDQMDNATASALMTLSKRQQQQLQKYQIQFASTNGIIPASSMANTMTNSNGQMPQAPSPHQQPPPPPPLNIEHQHQPLYGTHQHPPTSLANTRSLRLHRPTLYDPVSGSFVQSSVDNGPPNYNSHVHPMQQFNGNSKFNTQAGSNTVQFLHPHQTSTLLSRRSTNTLRSFQTSAGATYGQLMGAAAAMNSLGGTTSSVTDNLIGNHHTTFASMQPPTSQQMNQPQQLLQSHQAVIHQLNNSTYPSLPLKHVSAVRPQIMSSLEDQVELELAEKEQQLQQTDQQQPTSQQQQQQQQQAES